MEENIEKLKITIKPKKKEPILFILNNNFNKKVCDLSKIYKYNKFKNRNNIIELIKDIPVKIYLICKKSADKEEYNNRHKLLIKFNNLFKKFLKNKYERQEIKDKHINYTDISQDINDDYIVSFYVVISHEFGIFKDINHIIILMKEFNNILKNQKDNVFGKDFINLNIYNKNFCKNVFTYINSSTKKINIFNGNINNSKKIYNRYYFNNNLIGYYEDIKKVVILDNGTNTLDNYFKKLKIT